MAAWGGLENLHWNITWHLTTGNDKTQKRPHKSQKISCRYPAKQLKNKRPPAWCHLLFYFTSYVLNMFRTLIYPSSGICDYPVELPHWSYCSVKTEDLALAQIMVLVVCVWCDVLSRFVVVGKHISVDTDCYAVFCFVTFVFSCV